MARLSIKEPHVHTGGVDANDLLAAMPEAVVVLGVSGQISFANHAAQSLFGMGEKALCQSNISALLGETHPVLAAIASRRATILSDSILPDGRKLSRVSVTPIHEGQLITFVPDLLPRQKDWSRKLRDSMKPAQHMARALAHEIKNPLAGICGAAQLLEAAPSLAEEDVQLARLISREGARISRLVDRANIFDQDDTGDAVPLNVHSILDQVVEAARIGFGKHVAFSTDFDPSLPEIAGTADPLVQAFMNLIKNAVEAADPSNPRVVLRTRFQTMPVIHPENGQRLPISIDIEDNGRGIAQEMFDRLFEPYFTTKVTGEGLGLPIVYRVIDAHGGLVDMHSRPGQTIFTVSLSRSSLT